MDLEWEGLAMEVWRSAFLSIFLDKVAQFFLLTDILKETGGKRIALVSEVRNIGVVGRFYTSR
jgi:hypothetical protein